MTSCPCGPGSILKTFKDPGKTWQDHWTSKQLISEVRIFVKISRFPRKCGGCSALAVWLVSSSWQIWNIRRKSLKMESRLLHLKKIWSLEIVFPIVRAYVREDTLMKPAPCRGVLRTIVFDHSCVWKYSLAYFWTLCAPKSPCRDWKCFEHRV